MDFIDNKATWTFDDGSQMELIQLDELKNYPDGTTFKCINGSLVTKGKDYIDDDTRGGYIAYGIIKI